MSACGIYNIDIRIKLSAVSVIGKSGIFLPYRIQGARAIAHCEFPSGEIDGIAFRIGRPPYESMILLIRFLLGKRHRFAFVNRSHCRRASAAVRVETDKINGSFKPGGIKRHFGALLRSQSHFILFIRGIHTPVLFVVYIPTDEVVVIPCKRQRFGGRQSKRTEGAF